ncbi:unnamed protein product [Merluccius merluccius]
MSSSNGVEIDFEHGHEQHGHEQHGHEQHGHEQHGHEQHGHEQHGHEQHGHEQPVCGRLTDAPTWIIDPIDGTVNFVHRFPFVAISIAFAVNKQTEFGLVYSCVEDKLYSAQRGRGAFLNGVPLHTSRQEDVNQCLVVTEIGAERDDLALYTMTSNIMRLLQLPVHGVRAVGTAAVDMCLVATGGADVYYHIGMHCWDIAASAIIVQEAGGVVIDTDGSEFDMMSRKVIAASSLAVANRIAGVVQAFPCRRDDVDPPKCSTAGCMRLQSPGRPALRGAAARGSRQQQTARTT